MVFESGAVAPNGAIAGNDNDADAAGVEPHHTEIRTADQVQIYESVMSDSNGQPTTGLLTAVRYLKDNRLVPRGFDKATADSQIAVVGAAGADGDFGGGSDRVRYAIGIEEADGPFQIDVELRFQVIGFRWAENLRAVQSEGNQSIRRLLRIDGFLFVRSARDDHCSSAVNKPSRLRLLGRRCCRLAS